MYYVPDRPVPVEEQPVTFCDDCNGDLYEGDSFFRIGGDKVCSKECLANYFGIEEETVTKEGF